MKLKLITYELDGKLYLNITNRCSNNCSFCIRSNSKTFEYDLWLDREPDISEIINAITDALGKESKYTEVVFCGFGEPMMRLPELLESAGHIKKYNKKVRVNTNGQADLIWKKQVAPELEGLVDAISISLNAGSSDFYQELCSSDYGEAAFESILSFTAECKKYVPEVTLSVVDVIPQEEIDKCSIIAKKLGVQFRIRHMQD